MPSSDSPGQIAGSKFGCVLLAGLPNAGKSALFNASVGERLSIVVAKAQTTWGNVPGIRTEAGAQIVFVDTPGFVAGESLFRRALAAAREDAERKADVAVIVVDGAVAAADAREAPRVVAVNKADYRRRDPGVAEARAQQAGVPALRVSAKTGPGVDAALAFARANVPAGRFAVRRTTRRSGRRGSSSQELVREAVFEQFSQEAPYAVVVRVEEFLDDRSPVCIAVSLHAERASQKGMLVGREGAAVKRPGVEARRKIESFLGRRVHLDLRVKVWPGWRRKKEGLMESVMRRRAAAAESRRGRRGWRKASAVGALALVAGTAPGVADAQSGRAQAQEGALFLLLPVGARGVGLGRAMTALPTEEGAFWNPAALAEQKRRRVMVYRGDQLVGPSTAVNVLAPWHGVGTFGASYFLLDVGEQELRDQFGSTLGSLSVRNHLAIVSFAASFAGRIHAGVNMKLVQFRGACRGRCQDLETTSSAYAVDVGVQAIPLAGIPLRFGAMLAHAGTDFRIRNEEQADPLPMRLRFAAAYEVLHWIAEAAATELWLALEVEDRARDVGSPSYYLGLDFWAADLFSVSAGYVGGELDQTNGASAGVGFRFDRFDLHLAKSLTRSPVTGESEPVHVSFGVAF